MRRLVRPPWTRDQLDVSGHVLMTVVGQILFATDGATTPERRLGGYAQPRRATIELAIRRCTYCV